MGGAAGAVVTDIVGQSAYEAGKTAHLSGVVVKDDKLSITLEKPAPDFLPRIASSFFCAVPLNAPIDPKGVRELPSAGPYYIAEHEPNQRIVLARNPNYEGSRPRRLREIQYTIGVGPAKNIADVEAGRSDYVVDGVIPVDRETEAALAARYGPTSAAARSGAQRYFVNPTLALAYLADPSSRTHASEGPSTTRSTVGRSRGTGTSASPDPSPPSRPISTSRRICPARVARPSIHPRVTCARHVDSLLTCAERQSSIRATSNTVVVTLR